MSDQQNNLQPNQEQSHEEMLRILSEQGYMVIPPASVELDSEGELLEESTLQKEKTKNSSKLKNQIYNVSILEANLNLEYMKKLLKELNKTSTPSQIIILNCNGLSLRKKNLLGFKVDTYTRNMEFIKC